VGAQGRTEEETEVTWDVYLYQPHRLERSFEVSCAESTREEKLLQETCPQSRRK